MARNADEYRAKASHMRKLADAEPNLFLQESFEQMSRSYLQLAAHADGKGVEIPVTQSE
jgi:hypothetical protein